MSKQEPIQQTHEGEWIYISGAFAELGDIVRSKGWLAIGEEPAEDERRAAARRVNALRTADACVIDVGADSFEVGAELATAVFSGRPVIALEDAERPTSTFVSELLSGKPGVRTVRYSSSDDRAEALSRTLDDPVWLSSMGQATRHGSA
jgi:hypothetical protein